MPAHSTLGLDATEKSDAHTALKNHLQALLTYTQVIGSLSAYTSYSTIEVYDGLLSGRAGEFVTDFDRLGVKLTSVSGSPTGAAQSSVVRVYKADTGPTPGNLDFALTAGAGGDGAMDTVVFLHFMRSGNQDPEDLNASKSTCLGNKEGDMKSYTYNVPALKKALANTLSRGNVPDSLAATIERLRN
jgi:hypothetical protein